MCTTVPPHFLTYEYINPLNLFFILSWNYGTHGNFRLIRFRMWDFKFSRRRVWSSEMSSGMYCRVKQLSTDVSEVRVASIITAVHPRRQFWTSTKIQIIRLNRPVCISCLLLSVVQSISLPVCLLFPVAFTRLCTTVVAILFGCWRS
jgi:hypothetical protein